MSYNFKSLGEVELLNTMPETAKVFVEVDGSIRRAPQVQPVDEIAQIVGSETLEEVPEGATVLAEVGGEIKRVPSDGLGGGDPWDILISTDYDFETFTWVKGDHITLGNMLATGQPPRICIYWTNGDLQYPNGKYRFPVDINFGSGSGSYLYIYFMDGSYLNVNVHDGSISFYSGIPE